MVPQGLVRLQDHLPKEAEEKIVALAGGEVLDDIVLIAHGPPGAPLLLHVLLQLGDVLLGHVGLAQQVHQLVEVGQQAQSVVRLHRKRIDGL